MSGSGRAGPRPCIPQASEVCIRRQNQKRILGENQHWDKIEQFYSLQSMSLPFYGKFSFKSLRQKGQQLSKKRYTREETK